MIDYEVEAVLQIVDRASPQLEKMLALSTSLAGAWDKLKESGAGLFSGMGSRSLAGQLERINKALPETVGLLGRVGPAANANFAQFTTGAANATGAMRGLNAELREAVAQAGALGAAATGMRRSRSGGAGIAAGVPVGEPYGESARPAPWWRPAIPYRGAPLGETEGAPYYGMPAIRSGLPAVRGDSPVAGFAPFIGDHGFWWGGPSRGGPAIGPDEALYAGSGSADYDMPLPGQGPTSSTRGAGRGGGAGGRGGRGGGLHLGGRTPLPGIPGGHAYFGVTPGMAAAGALGYGAYEQIITDDALVRAILATGVKLSDGDFAHQKAQLQSIVGNVASTVGMTPATIAGAIPGIVRQMSGFPMGQRMAVMPKVLKFAALETRFKGVPLEEGADAMLGLMHLEGQYGADAINKLAKTVFAASLVSPLNLQQIERAASYSVPIVSKLQGVDPNELLMTSAFMQRAGMISTRSGTSEMAFYQSLMKGTHGGNLRTSGAHGAALRQLGLVDAGGHLTFLNQAGNVDTFAVIDKVADAEAKARASMTPDQFTQWRTSTYYQAFGTRGERFAALLLSPQFKEQMPALRSFVGQLGSESSLFEQYQQQSTLQDTRLAWTEFTKALMNLSDTVLPAFTVAIKGVTSIIHGINGATGSGVTDAAILGGGAYLASKTVRRGVKAAARGGARLLGGAEGAGALSALGAPGAIAGIGWLDLSVAGALKQETGAPWYSFIPGASFFGMNPEQYYMAHHPKPGGDARSGGASLPERIARAIKEALTGLAVNLDGREVGQVTADAIARAGHAPVTSPGRFDHSASPVPSPY